jgi:hypothetical protein
VGPLTPSTKLDIILAVAQPHQTPVQTVLAFIALLDNRIADADADAELTLAETIPTMLRQAHCEIALNHSFVSLTQARPDEAAAQFRVSREEAAQLELPHYAADHREIQQGLVAWASHDLTAAEEIFRQIIEMVPDRETAHHSLTELLREKGDTQGALSEEQTERISHSFENRTQGLAAVLFSTDPVRVEGHARPSNKAAAPRLGRSLIVRCQLLRNRRNCFGWVRRRRIN